MPADQRAGAGPQAVTPVASTIPTTVPMHRLLQGDVGSGKTVVAALAAAIAVEAGWQCALMAPTEILVEQHFRKLIGWLEPLGLQVAWLTGSRKGKARREMLQRAASGEAGLVGPRPDRLREVDVGLRVGGHGAGDRRERLHEVLEVDGAERRPGRRAELAHDDAAPGTGPAWRWRKRPSTWPRWRSVCAPAAAAATKSSCLLRSRSLRSMKALISPAISCRAPMAPETQE